MGFWCGLKGATATLLLFYFFWTDSVFITAIVFISRVGYIEIMEILTLKSRMKSTHIAFPGFLVGVIILFMQGCSLFPFTTNNPSTQFSKFVDDYYNGTFAVQRDHVEPFGWLLSDADSLKAVGAARALTALHQIDTTGLSIDDRIDWIQLNAGLNRDIYDTVLHTAQKDPGRYIDLGDLTRLVSSGQTPTVKQWADLSAALLNVPKMLAIGRKQLQNPPPLWVRLAVNTIQRYENALGDSFTQKVNTSAPDSLKSKLIAAGNTARESLTEYKSYIKDTLQPGEENSWAAGTAYYNRLLKDYHFLPYTASEMIETGMKMHNETKSLLAALGKRIDSTKSIPQLIAGLKLRHPEPYKITEAYHRQSDRVRKFLIDKNLVTIPAHETLLFVPTPPALRETYAWGGYGGIENIGALHQGEFFVTDIVPGMTQQQIDEKLRVQNNGWITVIALHEGYPGHHLQYLYALNNPRPVRVYSGNTYYVEGWALYAESWMARSGFYQNADDSLAWLQMRLWRTARVIVDPSIHTGKMTYEQAVQFMIDEVGLERSAAEAEVNRYTTWPTQAPSYIIGWLEIENLEKDLKTRLGSSFDEKRFVETVMGVGPLPLNLMKRAVLNAYGY